MVFVVAKIQNMGKQKRIGFCILRTPKGVRSLRWPIPCYMACQAAGLSLSIHQTSVVVQSTTQPFTGRQACEAL